MATHGNPFDRLGRDARDRAEAAVDRFRWGGRGDASLARELSSIGLTADEASRHVALVRATQ